MLEDDDAPIPETACSPEAIAALQAALERCVSEAADFPPPLPVGEKLSDTLRKQAAWGYAVLEVMRMAADHALSLTGEEKPLGEDAAKQLKALAMLLLIPPQEMFAVVKMAAKIATAMRENGVDPVAELPGAEIKMVPMNSSIAHELAARGLNPMSMPPLAPTGRQDN